MSARRLQAVVGILFWSAGAGLAGEAQDNLAAHPQDFSPAKPYHFVTTVAQVRALSGKDYLDECAFHLTGVVTLVDTNRDLVVLQDATGAVGLNFRLENHELRVGQLVSLDGTNISPYCASLPDYPHHPSGQDVRDLFEAPTDWGDYHLTRMRGYLCPPATGEYSFWIASDNSSELWLSLDAEPSNARRIAFIARFSWVGPREWSRFPSQRSEPILLKAGETYYIEALQEQTTLGDHLAVAWQGPAVDQSVIHGRYLIPWSHGRNRALFAATNGILREYWTNYSSGDLKGLGGPRPGGSALSVEKVRATILGQGQWPKPEWITLNRHWLAEDNFRWVEVEGSLTFVGEDRGMALLELVDGQKQVQVRALHWDPALSRRARQVPVRVAGVCEGVFDQEGTLGPGLIWASAEESISLLETARTNVNSVAIDQPILAAMTKTNPAMRGFYGTRGVVTFNDRVLGKDDLFVQEDTAAVLVSLEGRHFKNQLKVGQWVDLGGGLQPGKSLPIVSPLYVTELGWHTMPRPLPQPVDFPVPGNRDGRWTELDGVVHSVNSNGTMSLVGKSGPIYLWVGQTPSNSLSRYVDAKLRVRGVLSLSTLEAPVLLIPSGSFVDVEEEAPLDPFGVVRRSIADVIPFVLGSTSLHRVRLAGEVTYRGDQWFFLQDESGGLRVQTFSPPTVKVGEMVEVVGFPAARGSGRMITEALVSSGAGTPHAQPRKLDLSDALSFNESGTLIKVSADLLIQKTVGTSQVLELQQNQRLFTAILSTHDGVLSTIAPGSRLEISGVGDNELMTVEARADKAKEGHPVGLLNIWLRGPADVQVLRGPPWWTWRRTVTLVGALVAVLLVSLLWVHLLRRRLQRQQAIQRAFSRQVLERLENERRRIAVNLHDSLGQILLAIKNQALVAMQRAPVEPGLQQRLVEISESTSQAIEEVRQITHGLRPYQLDRLGLTQAIRAAVSRAAESCSVVFASRVEDIDGLFTKDSEIHVYRIVQEAVNNVVKHSAATEATVVIKKRVPLVSLSIRDNGRGFDAVAVGSAHPNGIGYGLSGIAERVRILAGSLVVDSRLTEGISLTVEVPISAGSNETGSNRTHCG